MPSKFPNVEPMGNGWRAVVSVGGKLRKGKTRATQRQAYADAEHLRNLRDVGQSEDMAVNLKKATEQVLAICELKGRRKGTENWYREKFAVLLKELGEGTKLLSVDRAVVQGDVITQRYITPHGPELRVAMEKLWE